MAFKQHLKQTITYWAPTGTNTYGGTTFAAPTQLRGRWEDKQEMIRDKRGEEIILNTRVYLEMDIAVDGYLYLGTSSTADPRSVSGAFEIRKSAKVPDLRQLQTLRVAYL